LETFTIKGENMPKSETFNRDCLDAMREMPDNAFDLAIIDPPYGIGRSGQTETFTIKKKHKRKFFEDKQWDNAIPTPDFFSELFRVSKNQVIFGANYFVEFLPPSMGWIFWDKGQDLSMSDGELVFTSFQRALRRFIMNRGRLMIEGNTIHPTQKPYALYKWLLKNYAKDGDSILDTHLGSGSSRIAAYDLGFDFTGFELDADYFNAQEKRFQDHIKQPTLFESIKVEAKQEGLFS
jgi:site-specific DNA-methyltransferase (adenine-specific)